MSEVILSPHVLKQFLRYEPETGKLFWLGHPKWTVQVSARLTGREAITAINKDGYFSGKVLGRTMLAHRVAWAIHHGEWPDGMIDHINGDRKDNRICNLKVTDRHGNGKNRASTRKASELPSGVSIDRRCKSRPYRAMIKIDGKRIHLGMHETPDQANSAYLKAAAQLGFSGRHGK